MSSPQPWEGHDRGDRGPADPCSCRTPLKAGAYRRAGRDRTVPGRWQTIRHARYRAADQVAGPGREHAAADPAVPQASAELVPIVDPEDRSEGRHRNAQPARSPGARPPAGSIRCRRSRSSELGAHAADLVQHAGARRERPAAVTAATATTPLQITCPRRTPGPPAVTAKTPKFGLEITVGRRAPESMADYLP
jgi:hypothetical protein